jgi:ribonuclease III, bacterial
LLNFKEKAPSVDSKRRAELFAFQEKIGIKFNDIELLNLAFTHTSYANECIGDVDNNERLEFLGDSVLGMVTAEYLFTSFPNLHEGDFSRIKSWVVSENSLAEVALTLDFERFLLMGRGEELQGGRKKKAIIADAMEAVIAAIYLDQGLECARGYVLSFIRTQVEKVIENKQSDKDYKSELQEYFQKRRRKCPEYELVSTRGPAHEQVFTVLVHLNTKTFGPAEGMNKKSAEQAAARMALIALGLEKE